MAVLFIACLAFAAYIALRAPEVLAAGQPAVTPGSATITDPGGSDLSGFMIVVEPSGHAWAIDGAGHASGELSPAITQSLFADLASAGPLAQLPEQPCTSALVIGWNGQRSRNLLCSSDARVARLMGDIDAIQKALYVHSYHTTASLYHTAAQPKLIAQSSARFWTSGQSAGTYSPTTYSPTTYTPTTYTPYSYNASSSASTPLYNGAGSPYGNTGFDSSSTSFSQDFRIDPTQSFGQNNIGGNQNFSNGSSFTTNGTSFNNGAVTPSSSFGGSFNSGSTGGSFSGSSSFRSDFSGNFNSSTFGSGPNGPTTYGSGAPTSSYH